MSEGQIPSSRSQTNYGLVSIVAVLLVAVLVMAGIGFQPPEERTNTVAIDSYVFKDHSFSFQFLRTLSASLYGAADFGECVETAKKIKDGDFESWTVQWTATAERIKGLGDEALAEGHDISAAECYLRAANYYRTAEFYLHGNPHDPRIIHLWEQSKELFVKSLTLSGVNFEQVNIAYEDTTLPGYFYPVDESGEERATLILMNGFDGTQEELYGTVLMAIKRGYNVLTFEGPGQGEVLRVQNLTFRHDWEAVITPVIDHLENRSDVDRERIALWGLSMGGYLAPRAASFDHRLAALICDGGVYDIVGGTAQEFMPDMSMQDAKMAFLWDMTQKTDYYNAFFYDMMANSTNMRWSLQHGMYAFGESTPVDYYLALSEMSMYGLAGNISCPTLVCDGTNDTAMPRGQAVMLFTNLTCPATYHLFTSTDGAGLHCQLGAAMQGNMVKLNWLEKALPA
ncbi:MAG TPA: alpha/beta fold hydrolase [Methanomassiliicoccales archaeon]|nr:alpha/beta fold hydrolase [Methanomassiliicoccales archaeon]